MAVDDPGYRANFGTAEQLPYGEAQALNTPVPPEQDLAALLANASPPAGPPSPGGQGEVPRSDSPAGPPVPEPQPEAFRPSTDEERFLFGPTERPNEPATMGVSATGKVAPPESAYRILPMLRRAASAPNASPQLQALLALVLYHMGENP